MIWWISPASPTHAAASQQVSRPASTSVVVANVPGPANRAFLGRARLRDVYALNSTTDDEDVSVAITNYRGRCRRHRSGAPPPVGQRHR